MEPCIFWGHSFIDHWTSVSITLKLKRNCLRTVIRASVQSGFLIMSSCNTAAVVSWGEWCKPLGCGQGTAAWPGALWTVAMVMSYDPCAVWSCCFPSGSVGLGLGFPLPGGGECRLTSLCPQAFTCMASQGWAHHKSGFGPQVFQSAKGGHGFAGRDKLK